ncbi:MAG TPA: DUF4149 domain-containing protein [Gammaproteobacteria bacterium]|nr:DUF4149 domain-containing protein [Gammaproteobacteria bacterium]
MSSVRGLLSGSTAARIALTLWVGGMWITGYLVAPVLFNMLDKQTAGDVAGQLFTIMSYVGLGCATLLLMDASTAGKAMWKQASVRLVIVMVLIVMIGQWVLQPMMVELKAQGLDQAAVATQFGRLHGVAQVLFMINSLLGLALVVFPDIRTTEA